MLIIDIIMAIWYGMRARQLGRHWLGWAVLGFFVPDLAFTLAVYVFAFLLTGGTTELEAEAAGLVFLGAVMTGIIAGIVVGHKTLKPRVQKAGGGFLDCPFCGIQNLATAGECKLCGARLGGAKPPLEETTAGRSKSEPPDSAEKG